MLFNGGTDLTQSDGKTLSIAAFWLACELSLIRTDQSYCTESRLPSYKPWACKRHVFVVFMHITLQTECFMWIRGVIWWNLWTAWICRSISGYRSVSVNTVPCHISVHAIDSEGLLRSDRNTFTHWTEPRLHFMIVEMLHDHYCTFTMMMFAGVLLLAVVCCSFSLMFFPWSPLKKIVSVIFFAPNLFLMYHYICFKIMIFFLFIMKLHPYLSDSFLSDFPPVLWFVLLSRLLLAFLIDFSSFYYLFVNFFS